MTTPIAWLIDTNVVSEMMRRQPEPRVAAYLDSIAAEGLGIASITVWEILDGIGRLPHGRRRESLAERFLDLLDDLFENRSSIGPWPMPARVPGSWKTNAGEVSRSTVMFRTPFSRRRLRAAD